MTAAIEIKNLTKAYGARLAVDDLNLTIPAGEIFGFVGPNGAGKTSTLRMAAGLLKPTAGKILVQGLDVFASPRQVHQAIGYMPDFFGSYPDLHVWEYLDFFGACYQIDDGKRPAMIQGLLELVDLAHRKDDLVDQLSTGLKQRLSLARTLIHEPQVLILDEPAAGLDPRARVEIRELLVELKRMGKTIFFSTHILADVEEICTSVGVLEAGKLVANGDLEQLHLQFVPRRKLSITLLDQGEPAQEILASLPGIQAVTPVDHQPTAHRLSFLCEFQGDDRQLSQALRQLVLQGVEVLQFNEDNRDLEEIFLHITRGIVS